MPPAVARAHATTALLRAAAAAAQVASPGHPSRLVDQNFLCGGTNQMTCGQFFQENSCFQGHCIADPDSMCSDPGRSDFVRLDVGSRFHMTEVFIAIDPNAFSDM